MKPETRVWKGDQQVKLTDLAAGDELLFNITGHTADNPGWCTDIWVGAETHQLATEQQAEEIHRVPKKRGLPGWIDKTEGNKLTVTLFSGDAATSKRTSSTASRPARRSSVCVANDELRTWNPPVDKERGSLVEVQRVPQDGYGTQRRAGRGEGANMLEGFRRGRVVRLFGAGLDDKDQPLRREPHGLRLRTPAGRNCWRIPPKEYPAQFPFRTDYGNEHLPWFKLKDGASAAALRRAPRLRRAREGRRRHAHRPISHRSHRRDRGFHAAPEGPGALSQRRVTLADLPLGTRCRFSFSRMKRAPSPRRAWSAMSSAIPRRTPSPGSRRGAETRRAASCSSAGSSPR